MCGDEEFSLTPTKGNPGLDVEKHSEMFRSSDRSSSPFSLMDMDIWDTKSQFTAQSSAWCGMAAVSGSGFLSKVSTSASGSTGGFRRSDPGLRRWQSQSHLAPQVTPRSFSPSPGAELRAARADSGFRQSEMMQWLQEAHRNLDSQRDLLKTTDTQLSHNRNATKQHDLKHGQLAERTPLDHERAAKLSEFEKSKQDGELSKEVLQLEKELLQTRSALDKRNNVEKTSDSLLRTLQMNHEGLIKQERQVMDAELCKLREALREAEARVKIQEAEQNQAFQKLQASTEAHRALLNQTEELNQKLDQAAHVHSEVQEQLSEANNKISQACLEKAMLSTQVLKLEDDIKELRTKLSEALSDKYCLIQEKADLQHKAQLLELQLQKSDQSSEGCERLVNSKPDNHKQESVSVEEQTALTQVNERLTRELEEIKQTLQKLQTELQEQTAEMVIKCDQITALEDGRTQLIREKEELLSKMNKEQHKQMTDMKEKYKKLREAFESLESEKQRLQDHCLSIEAEVFEKDEKLQLQEEKYLEVDAKRIQRIEALQAEASHWTEKWQTVALTLQSTQAELQKLKRKNSKNETKCTALDVHVTAEIEKLKNEGQKDKEEIENLLQHKANMEALQTRAKKELDSLRLAFDVCKQELELEQNRSRTLLRRNKGGSGEAVQSEDKGTMTDLNISSAGSSLFLENPFVSQKSQNKSPQASGDDQNEEDQMDSQTMECLKAQLEESRRMTNQLLQEKMLDVQKLQTLKQLSLVKDEKSSVDGRKDKPVCPPNLDTDQQRRMVTEQLKTLFKEREGNEKRTEDDGLGSYSQQDWAQTSNGIKSALERRSWHYGSGLMPVFEEDEENDGSVNEEKEPKEKAHAEENIHAQGDQSVDTSVTMSVMTVEFNNRMAKNENPLEDSTSLNIKQPINSLHTDAKKELDLSSDHFKASLSDCPDTTVLQQGPPLFYPDGTFVAKFVDISSPDEAEDEEEHK